MTAASFDVLVCAMRGDQASDYLARIGDTPELAEDGRVIVRGDGGCELARVVWPD